MKPLFRFAMLALALVVVALVSALTAMRFAIHGQEVEVPAVLGLTPPDAERSVSGLGFQIEVERQYYSATIPEGRIMTQMPLPGTKVRRGWQLRVAQSMGPQRVSIPDVTRQSERAAELNIRRRGLEVASITEIQLPGTPTDLVVAQSPPANASQVAAPKTSLLVTVTADAPAFVVPNFVGQPLGTASRTLQDAGFRLGTVSMAPAQANAVAPNSATASTAPSPSPAPPQPSPASMIVTQWPPAGQKVLAGAVLNFEVR
ncbi:MAG: eukaryotic-like serine/threonine-protein kinase [Acidobacteriaceae bacterium]|jgi:beta-lactam-binding protein with PASTA domain|nr:eukaryotic-like serine/threonine-protein kinase [Acidobacteriaceae bacterium]